MTSVILLECFTQLLCSSFSRDPVFSKLKPETVIIEANSLKSIIAGLHDHLNQG